jgi:hypothetical protein
MRKTVAGKVTYIKWKKITKKCIRLSDLQLVCKPASILAKASPFGICETAGRLR